MTKELLELEVTAALGLISESRRAIVGGREVFTEADLVGAVRAANSYWGLGLDLDDATEEVSDPAQVATATEEAETAPEVPAPEVAETPAPETPAVPETPEVPAPETQEAPAPEVPAAKAKK